jgi:hypothetical protein
MVLVKQQGDPVGTPFVLGWLGVAMLTLIIGGLSFRGGVLSLLFGGTLVAACGVVLVLVQRSFARLLPLSLDDVHTVATVVVGVAIGMLVTSLLCLIAIPQARRYASWVEADDASASAGSTMKGFSPVTARTQAATPTAMVILPTSSRRRLWIMIGGAVVGVVGGLIVASSLPSRDHGAATAGKGSATTAGKPKAKVVEVDHPVEPADGGVAGGGSDTSADAGGATSTGPAVPAAATSPRELMTALHARLAHGADLDDLLHGDVVGFGVDADELARGRAAVVAAVRRDLGTPPSDGFAIDASALQLGTAHDHAWITELVEVRASGQPARRFSLAVLAANLTGRWVVIAWHWGVAVPDALADRLAAAGKLPRPVAIPDHRDGPVELDASVRAAFASRHAFIDALSDRADVVNIGSGPGERIRGGEAIKRVFSRLHAELSLHDGALITAASAWDARQHAGPTIAWAALNVDFELDGHATQTFRVLAVLVRDDAGWRLVLTQWSNGGPLH